MFDRILNTPRDERGNEISLALKVEMKVYQNIKLLNWIPWILVVSGYHLNSNFQDFKNFIGKLNMLKRIILP